MGLRQTIENHIVAVVCTVAAAAFVAGWHAHLAVQEAAQLTVISVDRLAELKLVASLGKEELLKENEVLKAEIERREKRMQDLYNRILLNAPIGNAKVSNIRLEPESPGEIALGDEIFISFDYQVANDREVSIYAYGDGPADQYGASQPLSGVGTAKRWIRSTVAGHVTEISIQMIDRDTGELLHEMRIPVDYVFK